ncbi:uncharacterized protein DDB_G0271670 isoform X2 [Anopheles cruzii]|uniref:uncharacterized protein DDB_G0271670 isoform X2 n=1 Tax=Anopheles cruzii TaxID=68878 RepID=UPI0022EC3E58|nr:uncharacterized protein DDB_G0271670 isoform X2 [Anopheles cruzii]
MSLESGIEQVESVHFLRHPDDVGLLDHPNATKAGPEAVPIADDGGTSTTPAIAAPPATATSDGGASEGPLNDLQTVPAAAAVDPNRAVAAVQTESERLAGPNNSSNVRNKGNNGNNNNAGATGTIKRKRRRGKSKRGKSCPTQPYSKTTQWKYHSGNFKRRQEYLLATARRNTPFLQSDQPPLVPYNTNRFLMEDHMPQVLTPSEDEEDFLTKDFAVVYEKERCEQLESLSHPELIQEYIKLLLDHEQVTRRLNALSASSSASAKSTANNSGGRGDEPMAGEAADADRENDNGCGSGGISKEKRLEERVRELTVENFELRRQLEHTNRMVLSAKSSPRYGAPTSSAFLGTVGLDQRMDGGGGEHRRIDDSTSEDSESDSSSTSTNSGKSKSSSSSSSSSSSASSMSDAEADEPMAAAEDPSSGDAPYGHMNGRVHHSPLPSPRLEADSPMANGADLSEDDEAYLPLSPRPPLAVE